MHCNFQIYRKQDQKHDHLSLLDLAKQYNFECFDYPFKRIWGLIVYLGDRIIVGFQACLPELEKKAILTAEIEYRKTKPFLDPVAPSATLQDVDSMYACEETIKEIVEKALTEEAEPYVKTTTVLRIRAK